MSEPEILPWPSKCRNCRASLRGLHCSSCGQSHRYSRLDFRELFDDAVVRVRNFDTAILRTVADLSIDPAKVCRDYLRGRRVPYVHPFKYALAGFALAILVALVLAWKRSGEPYGTTLEAINWAYDQLGQPATLLGTPILAAVLAVMFKTVEPKLRWVEHLVIVLYACGHAALLQAMLNPLQPVFGPASQLIYPLLPIVVLTWTMTGVLDTQWWKTLLGVLVGFIVMQLTVLTAIVLIRPEFAEILRAVAP